MSIKNCRFGPDSGTRTERIGLVPPDTEALREKKFCCQTGKKRVQYPQKE